ncbi:MAG TPA: pitrilysin family protein [Candidatus Binatia bacterium]|nr:pitrilysin family protein [Candidatus Binatia bacterium]
MLPRASLTALDNSIRLVTAPVPASEMTTVIIAVKVGARAERPDERGISHLVEHQVFKGSRQFASPIELNAALASIGAYYNASTNMEYTYFVVNCPQKNAMKALEIVSDIVLHPRIPESEFTREKRVVFEEVMSARQNDDHYAEILLEDLMYQHQPLGWDILGTFKTLRAIDRRRTLGFIKRWYEGRRMAVALVGGGDLGKLRRRAAALFSEVPEGTSRNWRPFWRGKTRRRVRHLYRDEKLTTLMYGVPGISMNSPLAVPSELLRQVFGGPISSRLYDRVREQKGLVYDIMADTTHYSDAGHLSVHTQASERNAPRVLELILEESRRLVKDKITAKELSTAKEVLFGELASMPENQESLAAYYVRGVLIAGRLTQLAELRKTIAMTELDTVRWLAWMMFWKKPWYLASIGRSSPRD